MRTQCMICCNNQTNKFKGNETMGVLAYLTPSRIHYSPTVCTSPHHVNKNCIKNIKTCLQVQKIKICNPRRTLNFPVFCARIHNETSHSQTLKPSGKKTAAYPVRAGCYTCQDHSCTSPRRRHQRTDRNYWQIPNSCMNPCWPHVYFYQYAYNNTKKGTRIILK